MTSRAEYDFTPSDEFMRAASSATKQSMLRAARAVSKRARKIVHRDKPHRVKRKYPSGYVTGPGDVDAKPLRLGIKAKAGRVRGTKFQFWGYARSKQGYSIYEEYGHELRGGGRKPAHPYLRKALEDEQTKIIPILRGEWQRNPKTRS